MTKLVGAIDQGTTSTRFMIIDEESAVVASAQVEHRQITPRPGWVEHDASEIWANTQTVIAQALDDASLAPEDLAAVGITNQRETVVAWDADTGEPVAPAIVWQDTRTSSLLEELGGDDGPERFMAQTGLPLATYFSGPKMRWLLDNGTQAQSLRMGTVDAWLAWKLTGRHATDPTNASRTMLMDLETLGWADELIGAFGVPAEALPEIVPSSGVVAECVGPLAGVPLAGILGDQQAALFGQACFSPGDAKNTYGTGCFLLLNTGPDISRSTNGLLTTVAAKVGDEPATYALEGSVAIAGAAVQWLRDNLRLIDDAPQVEALARSVPDNGDVYFVPAFSGLFAPYWRPDARGAIVGLTGHASAGHLARATLEAVAFQSAEVVEAMGRDAGFAPTELRVDGGMVANDLLMQFQSDLLGVPIIRPEVAETTVMGAAYAAGLAVGVWSDQAEIAAMWRSGGRWDPAMGPEERSRLMARWRQAVARTYDWHTDAGNGTA